MSNPYERLLVSKPPRPSENTARQSQPSKDARPAAPVSKPLSQPSKRRQVEKPLNLRYAVRPRFRFDIPDPPMDPKMLLGKLSTASYAKPFLSSLERDFRIPAIPSDPTFGIHANLVDTSMYSSPANLNLEDGALLHSVMTGRKGGNVLDKSDASRSGQKSASHISSDPSAPVAPWMRRMSYDEYIARDSAVPRQSLFLKDAAAKKRVQEKISAPEVQKRRMRNLLQSFETVTNNMKHPDRRKQHLRPVSVSPILPDFSNFGEEFIALEFDKDELLTVPARAKNDPEAMEESIQSTATISVAESLVSGQERKYAVVYTPTIGTLTKRKRKREELKEGDGDESNTKKIHFAEDETYRWVGEYSIREGRFGERGGKRGLSRSCFAVTEYSKKDSKKSVACLSTIGTTWKLRTRTQADAPSMLGKEGLSIRRDSRNANGDEDARYAILSGGAHAGASEERERKRKIAMLEED